MSGTGYGYDAPRIAMYRPAQQGELACPPGWCRASGRWEEIAGRGEGPWGYDLAVGRGRARPIDPAAREAALKVLRPQLEEFVKSAAKHPQALDPEEEYLLEAVKDWVGRLHVEMLK